MEMGRDREMEGERGIEMGRDREMEGERGIEMGCVSTVKKRVPMYKHSHCIYACLTSHRGGS